MTRPRTLLQLHFLAAAISLALASGNRHFRTDNTYWERLARIELEEALRVKWNLGVAKNVIIFIGDGMGPYTVTATRIYKGGESHRLHYEKFPHTGSLKTYNANYMVPDSASTATALLCGLKVNQYTVGVDATVTRDDCEASLNPRAHLKSLVQLAKEAGKSTGFVTTMRVTHATPAPLYAHCPNRYWECEGNMPASAVTAGCKDIARQLVEDFPGKDINVIMGGGRQMLVSDVMGTPSDPLDTWSCRSTDGRDLIADYKQDKIDRRLKYSFVSNNRELNNLDVDNTDYLLGIFANGHLMYEHQRDAGPEGMPSIVNMTEAAIKVLSKNVNGFFLMVEGGNIDVAHHRGKAKKAIHESAAMEDAVRLASSMVDDKETLIIVTADHTHGMIINGYAKRGSDIFGVIEQPAANGVNYTTLTYGTGGPGSFQYTVEYNANKEPRVVRRNPNLDDTTDFEYEQISAAQTAETYHGGGDVMIYAKGPQSHLFHTVHEQHYVYHVVAYAARLGSMSSFAGPAYSLALNFTANLLLIGSVYILNLITWH